MGTKESGDYWGLNPVFDVVVDKSVPNGVELLTFPKDIDKPD